MFVILLLFLRFGGYRFDKVWDRVEAVVRGNFHGSFHRRHRSGSARHAGCLRRGVAPRAADNAPLTTTREWREGGSINTILDRNG